MRRSGLAFALAGALAAGCLAAAADAAPAFAADGCEPGTYDYSAERPWALDALGADAAWATTSGAGITVAVVDSGVDAANAHLAAAILGGVDLVGDGERGDGLSDPYGHGTVIASNIAARPVAGSGVVGIAPEAGILSVRVFRGIDDESVEAGFGPSTARLADGIRWASEHGADVINVSLSVADDDPVLHAAVLQAQAAGALVVASGGNRETASDREDGPRYPAAYDGVLGVAAADRNGAVDAASIHGPHIDLAAPGADVLAAATGAGDCRYATSAPSTSWATGYVSGAAALVAAAHPAETPDEWGYRLTATAVRADPDVRDDASGWGVPDAAAALSAIVDGSLRGPVGPSGAAGAAVLPAQARLVESSGGSPFAPALGLAMALGIPAVALLGVLGTVLVYRRRRQPDAPVAVVPVEPDFAEAMSEGRRGA